MVDSDKLSYDILQFCLEVVIVLMDCLYCLLCHHGKFVF
jgi:hypothetical protein